MSVKEIRVEKKHAVKVLELLKSLGGMEEKKKIGEHKMTKDQLKLWEEFSAGYDRLEGLKKEVNNLKRKFWNKVKGDLEIFDKRMAVNDDNTIIEVYNSDCDCGHC